MKTDAEWMLWLKKNDAKRMLLIHAGVQVAGVAQVRRLSTGVYVTRATDNPANTLYEACASVGAGFVESISLDNNARLQQGSIMISDYDGRRESWVDDVWQNGDIEMLMGDPEWALDDFRVVFIGVIATFKRYDLNNFIITHRDLMEALNSSVTEERMEGDTLSDDAVVPTGLGEIHNATAALKSEATLTYKFNGRQSQGIIEVRDNAVPLANENMGWTAVTRFLNNGEFRLNQAPEGTITVSFWGDAVGGYKNTIGSLTIKLATEYGKESTRFTMANIETNPAVPGNFTTFEAQHPQGVGLWLPTKENVYLAINKLTSSVGAQVIMSMLARMRIFKLEFPITAPTFDILPSMYVAGSFKPNGETEVKPTATLAYNKNWTVQKELKTTMPPAHRASYATEWLTKTHTIKAVKDANKLSTQVDMAETMLLDGTDTQTETERVATMWSEKHPMYTFEGHPELFPLQLGQQVRVFYRRFGFKFGRNAIIISREPIYTTAHVKIGIIV